MVISGIMRESDIAWSSSAWRFFMTSARRLNSQKKYDSEIELVSDPATLYESRQSSELSQIK